MPKEITVKTILNKTKQRDSWFLDDYTLNLYSSCSFNCLYCYIRGSKYGTNLEESLSVKTNAIDLLEQQLAHRAAKGQYGIIVLSSATDPYLRIEKRYELTRRALEVIAQHRFPVHLITKSDLILRDLDLLHRINKTAILPEDLQPDLGRGVIVSFSFSTLDDGIGKIFEPGATPPSHRLEALQQMVDTGLLSGVSMMPLLPYISDTTASLHTLFSTFKAAAAHYLLPATITLFGDGRADSKTLMLHAIKKHYPELEARYLRFFGDSHQMPAYYQDAFHRKMKEMSHEYNLPDRILDAVKRME
ncbi:SPL family radical SAM protein [Flavilitoribacter nigricans]|uniref:Radical SAM protein n=1 Tax=Flavilitoribacter nigricans (strain ATCC 23147 / DSM 23189 / NBRC 102662 / NCIMB 1420 / SS-2) TaxID=1122177 RepID=A0A2D0NIU5_FLAN2|nr:radical SAM protein [Flavilitoribacter nigricans]PHN08119.1 radical SAM protein [Flavilitoribacter nigricans DSM 23189 = NBRC 102662]